MASFEKEKTHDRARMTQIMNLLLLAPDIQEEILFLPRTTSGRDPIREHHIRLITTVLDWRKQRRLWKQLFYRAFDTKKSDSMILPDGVD
ncbi:MAG: hypothetical protein JXA11_02310 [Phycisphaerae bacterium]|nr:hypothetical protein [Phycisphaerae bacterium]